MISSSVPRVSVVMSVYNDVGRLEKAVASILCQTFRDLELIAINDGSTDGSGELLYRLAAKAAGGPTPDMRAFRAMSVVVGWRQASRVAEFGQGLLGRRYGRSTRKQSWMA